MPSSIQLVEVCRHYQHGGGEVKALNDINVEIDQGDFVALVGPSGSGKSTLLNLLGGLDRPTSGKLVVQGVNLSDDEPDSEEILNAHRRDNVGFIFQTFNLLPTLSALENAALPLMLKGFSLAERNQRAKALLERVGLGHRLHHRPAELSGGEQQRAAIARALVNDPKLILADEPTGNLDSSTGGEVMSLLRELNTERTVTLIMVTHDPEVAAYADWSIHLRDGNIAEINRSSEGKPRRGSSAVQKDDLAPREDANPHIDTGGKLRFSDLVRTAVDNLRRRPIRNVLTTTGILIGIITLVAMVSFGVGVQHEVRRNFETLGLENVFVSPTFPEEEDAFDPFGLEQPLRPLTPEAVGLFRTMPAVQSVTPMLDLPANLEVSMAYGEISRPVRLSNALGGGHPGPGPGTGMPLPSDMLTGEALGEGDTEGLVLPKGLAEQLLGDTGSAEEGLAGLVGQPVTLTVRLPRGETKEFRTIIRGVQSGRSTQRVDLGVEERTAIKAWWYGRPDTLETDGYDMLVVRAVDETQVSAILETAEELNLQAQSLGAFLEIANKVLAILQTLLGSVGSLALLVAALGVANTMMMAIYERTREIGVLKALGARSSEVRGLFTAEAVLLGLTGGVIGLILGTLLGRLIDWIGHLYLASEGVTGVGQMSIVPVWLALGSLAFAGLIGVLGGLYPAARAAKLDPVAALRHE